MSNRTRVLAISSGGGHWVQLLRLRPAFAELDMAFASVRREQAAEVPGERYYAVKDATRREWPRLFIMVPQVAWVILMERPAAVITTGALPGLVGLALGKLLGARTLWVDSIANGERLSGSGEFARWFADQRLTQWPELARDGGPEYWGAVI